MNSIMGFSLVVVQHEDKFICVHEKGDRGWWLPGGGVDEKQLFSEAAAREVLEEAGVEIALTGVLRIEQNFGRLRVIYKGIQRDVSQSLKSIADEESKGARYVRLTDAKSIARGDYAGCDNSCWLRGPEPLQWFEWCLNHSPYPLRLFHQVRIGDDDSGACADRKAYPTKRQVKLVICSAHTNPAAILLYGGKDHTGRGIVFGANCENDETFLDAANGLVARYSMMNCTEGGALATASSVAITGVVVVEHYLHVEDADFKNHFALMRVTYCAVVRDMDRMACLKGFWLSADAFGSSEEFLMSSSSVTTVADDAYPTADVISRVLQDEVYPTSVLVFDENAEVGTFSPNRTFLDAFDEVTDAAKRRPLDDGSDREEGLFTCCCG